MSAAGRIFVVSGPSGSGKSTLIREVRQKVSDLGYSISHTSRPPRGQEKNGVEYHFVSKENFQKMIDNGDFVEWAEVYQDLYGTSVSSLRSQITVGLDVIMDIDVQGARNIKDHFKEAILIYVLPPSLEILEKRLRERGTDDEKAIRTRLKKAGEGDQELCLLRLPPLQRPTRSSGGGAEVHRYRGTMPEVGPAPQGSDPVQPGRSLAGC